MSLNDPLSAALSHILNCENVGKKKCLIKPMSKIIKATLNIMKEHRYLGEVREIDDGKGGTLAVNLIGQINKCGSIKPVVIFKSLLTKAESTQIGVLREVTPK